jgi:hypothetical protein
MVFVVEARRILSYHQHLPDEQRPPKSIWHSLKKCQAWIEEHNPYKDSKDKTPQGQLSLDDWEHE